MLRLWSGLTTVLTSAAIFAYAASAEPAEIEFWDMIWGSKEYPVAAQALVDEFNASQDDVEVNYRSVPWSGWYETFVTAVASGSAPDVSTGASFQAVQLYDFDAIMPVDALIEEMRADGTIADIPQRYLDAMQYDGVHVGFPWNTAMRVWFYRADILAEHGVEPPTNWDELRAAARAVTGDGTYGVVFAGADGGGQHSMHTLMLNNGGGVFTEDRTSNLSAEENVEALEFIQALAQDGSVHPASIGYKSGDAHQAFERGDAAFIVDIPSRFAKSPAAGSIRMLPPLKSPDGEIGALYFVNNIMVYSDTQHPEAALKFVRWWSENNLPLWTEGAAGQIPVRASLLEDDHFPEGGDARVAVTQYSDALKTFGSKADGAFPALNSVDGDGFLRTLIQDVLSGKDISAALEQAEKQLTAILDN